MDEYVMPVRGTRVTGWILLLAGILQLLIISPYFFVGLFVGASIVSMIITPLFTLSLANALLQLGRRIDKVSMEKSQLLVWVVWAGVALIAWAILVLFPIDGIMSLMSKLFNEGTSVLNINPILWSLPLWVAAFIFLFLPLTRKQPPHPTI